MKTKEELNALKEEVEVLNKKLQELTPEELEQVSGGVLTPEAEDWINRNYDAIVDRTPANMKGLIGSVMNYVTTTEQIFNISTLKSTLKNNFGINVDDL